MSLLLVLIIILVLFGGGGYYGYRSGWYGGNSLIGLLVFIILLGVLLRFAGLY